VLFQSHLADLGESCVGKVHYNAREGGGPSQGANSIRYALVVTVRCPGMPDLYNRILQHYRTQLRPLLPVAIQVPLPRR
jgi:hypothetical protein